MRSVLDIGRAALCGVLVAAASGCALPLHTAAPRTPALARTIVLNGFPVIVHLSPAVSSGPRPLLVYSTGDAGWRGKDLEVYEQLVSWGYATAGFSAPQYVKHLKGDAETTTPPLLARDFAAIIALAKRALALPESTPVILVGVSRGAGLSVVAAGQRVLRDTLDGVVAIGLTKEEEHVRWQFRRTPAQVDIYGYLPRLGSLPVAVIQSTRDNYLPADSARELFGPDTARRQFHAIEAKNHSFAGARAPLYDSVRQALDWVDACNQDGEGATRP